MGAAEIRAGLGASYETTLVVLFLAPGLLAFLVEPLLFLAADRYPRRWFVCGGGLLMGLAAFAAALAPTAAVLAVAIALAYLGSGSGVALSQATLVDARPHERERVLARWALLGEVGDLLAPALLAALATVGLGWRAGFVAVGVAMLAWTALVAHQPFPAPAPDDAAEPSTLRDNLRAALRSRRLLAWLAAAALCDLLDEILVVFASLYLRDVLGVDPVLRSLVLGAGVAGAIAGALVTDRLLARVRPMRLLLVASLACIAAYAAWLSVTEIWLSALLFALVGATAAPMYPIVSARAYAALPGRSGTVHATAHLFTPLQLALPWLLGAVADAAGLELALALLVAQPLTLAVIALRARRSHRP